MSNVQLARDPYDAVNRGDIAAGPGMVDPGIGWREAEGSPDQPGGRP